MGKQKKVAQQGTEAPARKPASPVVTIALGLFAFVVGGAATYLLAAEPRPLGVPIPPPPPPIYKISKEKGAKYSVIHRVLPMGWLVRLAPQPDGLPYLHEHYHSDKLGFDISYPYGIENVEYSFDTFMKDAVESQANVKIDQPLAAIKVSLPMNDGKTQLQFAADLIANALKEGAKPVDQPHDVKLPGGGFATLAYRRSAADNNYVHRLYCAVVKKRILIFDFFIRPETASDGERYADKIMRSFDPGAVLRPAMEEPPAKKAAAAGETSAQKNPTTP